MNAERRLIEYCKWLQEPGICYMPNAGTLGRVSDEGPNAGRRTDVQSDGGMGAMVDRMFYALQQDNRCRELAGMAGLPFVERVPGEDDEPRRFMPGVRAKEVAV